MIRGCFLSTLICLALVGFCAPGTAEVLINEIMYHPSSEDPREEYIELYNSAPTNVSLAGWRFSNGVQFTFPSNTLIRASNYLVVAAHRQSFMNKYPTVTNVIGDWIFMRVTNVVGHTITNYQNLLSNTRNDIDLDNPSGERMDSVEYADEGDWAIRQRGLDQLGYRGWIWYKEHDGLGKSLELINPHLPNEHGQNWAASLPVEGTPGRVNSVLSTNIAPLILDVTHFPVVPTSSDPIRITARILNDFGSTVTAGLRWRVDSATPPAFTSTAMFDDGAHGDGVAGDGLYGVILPAQTDNAVIEFYVEASDGQGNSRTWPGPAIQSEDGFGPSGQVVNALLQVDNSPQNVFGGTPSMQPVYKVILTAAERVELAAIPCSPSQNSDAQMNATFISLDAGGTELRYLCSIRNRGHASRCASPPNYRVNFVSDRRWKGVLGLNLNTRQVHLQVLGSTLAIKAGAVGTHSRAVQMRVNNQNLAQSGSPMFGSYAANEAYGVDWAERHFPLDSGGSIYKQVRDIDPSAFEYRGEDPNNYRNTYFKETNVSEDDWTDLIGMLSVMGFQFSGLGQPNPLPFTDENVRAVINVDQWLTHVALMSLVGNSESGINSGHNDDYYMYRGIDDPRFILMFHDLDQLFGIGGQAYPPEDTIWGATSHPPPGDGRPGTQDDDGLGLAFNVFLRSFDYEPLYYRKLQDLMDTTLSSAQFDPFVDQVLGGWVTPGPIATIKSYMAQRRAYVEGVIAGLVPPKAGIATISGEPRSPTPSRNATLTVGGAGISHYRFKLNNGAYGSETPVGTSIQLSNLPNGSTNTVYVIGKNTNNVWQGTESPTVSRSWIVNTAWPTVRINEVLARNVSAVNHNGTFPDIIELYNDGASSVDLSGMRLTDDASDPNKFTFPNGTTLASGAYLPLYANNNDGTPGFHLGFSLDQNGDGVFLYHGISGGGALLDSVVFGLQLPDLSIGRLASGAGPNSGTWVLTQPTSDAANIAQLIGSERNLKINEWLAAAQSPFPEDFVELVNLDPLPVALGGLYLTDNPIGVPRRNPIAPLSFIAGSSYLVLLADNDPTQGADHLNFALASEQGEIALLNSSLTVLDCVAYGPQRPGISFGRCPDGGSSVLALVQPTPGFGNQCPVPPPPPTVITLLRMNDFWRYDASGNDLGTNWRGTNYDDSAWAQGRGVLGNDNGNNPFVQSLTNTVLPLTTTEGAMIVTYYFRAHFQYTGGPPTSLIFTNLIDDGVVVYLNGQEVYRMNMPTGAVSAATQPLQNAETTSFTDITVPYTNNFLQTGDNLIAAELHQFNQPADINLGLTLGVIIVTNNPAAAGVILNEVLANNASLAEPDGSTPDWVELFNPSTTNAVNLTGMSLGDFAGNRWVFPPGSILNARAYRVIRFDGDAPVSATNAGFGLKSSGDTVYLFNSPPGLGGIRDSIRFGIQAADFSIGRSSPTGSNWVLNLPTPGATNLAATLGSVSLLKVNEWMAAPASGDDWFEIYNPNSQPVAIGGCFLTDRLDQPTKHRIDALSFLGTLTNAWQKFIADDPATYNGSDHVAFKLDATMEAIGIFSTNGTEIDKIGYGQQITGVSQGRLPDGSANFTNFVGTASPGDANFLLLANVVVNEVLTHTDPPLEDAIELHNPSASPVNISGWWLSDSRGVARKYQIPPGYTIPARGFLVFYEYQFNNDTNAALPFALSSADGDQVYLSAATNNGTALTGFRAFADFGPAANGVSFGRFRTTVGVDYPATSRRTFGVDFPSSVQNFRTGTGASNAYPLVGPVVLSEVMYHPPDIGTNDNVIEEFVELHNITSNSIPLFDPLHASNRWRLRAGVDFDFPPNTVLAPGAYALVVSFDPLTNPSALAAFQIRYGSNSTLLGPYSGKLDNGGEDVELYRPDPPQVSGGDAGKVPYILVDKVVYSDRAPWPTNADGFGPSLQRINHTLYGNEPTNWLAAAATPGPAGPRDRDADGMPDEWEIQYGFNTNNASDASLDFDMDGATNLEEYLAGTHPKNSSSNLKLTVVSMSGGTVTLRFTAVAGRTYSIIYFDSPDDGFWFKVRDVAAQGFTQDVTVTDPAAGSSGQRFYQLVTPQAP